MPNILDFHVHEFSPLNSDAHCPVALTLNTEIFEDPSYPENNYSMSKPKLWNSDKSESLINNIDILKVAETEMHLDRIQSKNNVSKGEIDNIVSELGALFESTAQETFGSIKKKKSTGKKSHFKPWFNVEWFRKRNLYHRSRRLYNKYKTDYYKNMLKIVSKKYKKTVTYTNRRFITEKSNQLRSLKNPASPRILEDSKFTQGVTRWFLSVFQIY